MLHVGTVVGAFVVVRAVLFASGLRFQANPAGQIHLLDLGELRADPFLAFTANHIQPPLFNFFVGSVSRWSPFGTGISFQVLYFVMGLVTVVVLWVLLVDLGARRWAATVAAVGVGWSPLAIRNEAVLTYETPTAMIVVLSVWTFVRYVRCPGTLRLALFVSTLVVGVWTRTTLNPIWFVGALVLVVLAPPRNRRVPWGRVATVVGVAVVLAVLPALHNQVRFHSPGYSSFAGMNLSRSTVLQLPRSELDRLVDEGRLSPAAKIVPYSPYADYEAVFGPCEADTGLPVLDDVVKATSGDRNMNAECYLPAYHRARSDAFAALRADPGAYARAVLASGLVYERWDVHAADPGNAAWRRWVSITTPTMIPVDLRYTPLGSDAQPYAVSVTALVDVNRFSLTIAAALILSIALGVRSLVRIRRATADAADWARLYLAYTVACVSAVSVLFDSFENARFREPLDPVLLGPLYVFVLEGVNGLVGAVRSRREAAGSAGDRRGPSRRRVSPTPRVTHASTATKKGPSTIGSIASRNRAFS